MKMPTKMYEHEFVKTFETFQALLPGQPWAKQCGKVETTIRQTPHLGDYLLRQNRLMFTLRQMADLKADERLDPRNPTVFEAMTFVTQVVNLHGLMREKRQKELIARVSISFLQITELRGLKFELGVAMHFAKRGYEIDIPETHAGRGNFDWLVTKDGASTEIECKSISVDKGSGIHEREAREFFDLALEALKSSIKDLKDNVLMRVVLPGRLPGPQKDRQAICALLPQAVGCDKDLKTELCEISSSCFSPASTPLESGQFTTENLHAFADRQLGFKDRHIAMMTPRAGGGIFVLVLENVRDSDRLKGVFDILSEAARRQLTGTIQGILCANLEGVTPTELRELGDESRGMSHLRLKTHNFLSEETRNHVVGVTFMALGDEILSNDGRLTQDGASYSFDNAEGKFGVPKVFEDLISTA